MVASNIKLLALDLDDTLLGADFQISAENCNTIRRAVAGGVLVTLATGRMFRSALPYAKQLQIDLPLITYHGALIRTAAGEENLCHRPVPLKLARQVAAMAAAGSYHLNAYIDDELFVAEENEFSRYYQQLANVKVTAVGDLSVYLETAPTKLTIIGSDDSLTEIKNALIENYGNELSIVISRPNFLEITDRLATKGQALHFLAKMQNIPREQVAAIGDSYNDLDMILYAGFGVAVANAREEVKSIADIITAKNTDDGVAVFIKQYLFDEKEEIF